MPAVINIIQGDIIMSFEFIRKLPTPTDIKRDFPVPERVAELKKERDKEIADVIPARSVPFSGKGLLYPGRMFHAFRHQSIAP